MEGSIKFKVFSIILCTILLIFPSSQVLGSTKEVATPEISLEDAIQLALSNDEAYKKAEIEVDKNSELAEWAVISMSGYSTTGVSGVTAVQMLNYQSANITYEMSKKSLQSNEDRVTNSITQKYGAVLVAEARYLKAQSDASLAERDYMVAKTKWRIGLISQLAFEAAQKSYESSSDTLDASKQEFDSAYAAFNPLVGLWAVDRPILTDGTEFNNLEIADLEHEVYRVSESAPDIWLVEQQAVLTDYQMNVLVYTGNYQPYEARQAEVEQAKLDVISTKKAYANTTRSIYYQIKALESQYAVLENAVQQADISVRTQQAMFDAGMITKLDLDKAVNTMEDYRSQLVELKWTHKNLVNTFEKPWAASSGS